MTFNKTREKNKLMKEGNETTGNEEGTKSVLQDYRFSNKWKGSKVRFVEKKIN